MPGPPHEAALDVGSALDRSFFGRHSTVVAGELLNKLLVVGSPPATGGSARVGRIVEVEAYGGTDDPASHGHRRRTPRNDSMFGPPGRLYVYFTYGMHHCTNVAAGADGEASAVLLRALTPVSGLDEMRRARPACALDSQLCAGPGRLSLALGLDLTFDGADLVAADRGVYVVDDGVPPPMAPGVSERIGVSAGRDLSWRFYVPSAPGLSRPG